jgi:hypothetical protein
MFAVPSFAFICKSGEMLPFQSAVFAPDVIGETGSDEGAQRLFPNVGVLVVVAFNGGCSHGGKGR